MSGWFDINFLLFPSILTWLVTNIFFQRSGVFSAHGLAPKVVSPFWAREWPQHLVMDVGQNGTDVAMRCTKWFSQRAIRLMLSSIGSVGDFVAVELVELVERAERVEREETGWNYWELALQILAVGSGVAAQRGWRNLACGLDVARRDNQEPYWDC